MKLADVALVASNEYLRHREFNLRCAYIASHFTNYVQGNDCGEIRKIALVASHAQEPDVFVEELRVAKLTRFFDFDHFWSASRNDRQKTVLTFLVEGCRIIATHEHWSVTAFDAARERVMDDDFYFGRFVRRMKASPDRKLSAGVWFEVDDVRAVVEVRVLDGSGEIVDRHRVAETEPVARWYVPYLGDVWWIDSRKVELRSKGTTPTVFRIHDSRSGADQ